MADASDVVSKLSNALAPSKVTSGGSSSFHKGQNDSILPSQIDDAQYQKGINISTRRGYISPRPGYIQQKFTLINDGQYTDAYGTNTTLRKIFDSGKFQGACKYIMSMGERIVAVYSGLIFILNPKKRIAQYVPIEKEYSRISKIEELLEPDTQRLNQYARRHSFSQAGDKLVIFDYPDRPIILDGYHAYRSPVGRTDVMGNRVYYVPATVMGCYNNNRLYVCSAANEFTAGDPVGSLMAPDAPITFNELYQEAGEFRGQVMSLGSTNKNNPITAMGFLQVTDTSTGIGPMFVATKDSIYSYRTDLPRASWGKGETPFGNMILYNAGIIGNKAVDNLNSDLFFMSADGHLRSFAVSKEYSGNWNNVPIDVEVWNWLKTSSTLKDLTVLKYFGNKLLCTAQPFRTGAVDLRGKMVEDFAFKGVVVLEFDGISGLEKNTNPSWAGIWTGVTVQDMVECNDELYVFAKDPIATNDIYWLNFDATQDFYEGKSKNIGCRIYTKQYAPESLWTDKIERTVTVGIQDISGKMDVVISRSNDFAQYSLWKKWEYEAPYCTRKAPVSLSKHYFRELNFGSPDEVDCNPVTREYGDLYRGTQFKIDISAASWRIDYLLVVSDIQSTDHANNVCEIKPGVEYPLRCDKPDLAMYYTADYVEDVWR